MPNSSIPEAFVRQMQNQLGNNYHLFEASLDKPSPVSIRLNTLKKFKPPEEMTVPWSPNGVYLPERPSFTLDPAFHAGGYYVQEASSMFLEHVIRCLSHQSDPIVLDLCAAPGGKSTNLLTVLPLSSLLVSNEVIRSRATILSENIQKWGYPNVLVTNNDPRDFQAITGLFDIIVVDAPCSGEGLFRKDEEAMSEWSEENIQLCSQRQQRIISEVWPALKEGGLLIYSTCTFNRLENEENLHWLKQNFQAEFLSVPIQSAWGVKEIQEQGIVGYRFYPHMVEGEGLFMAAIRKTSQETAINIKSKNKLANLPEKKKAAFSNWILEPDRFEWMEHQDLIIVLPKFWLAEINWMQQHLSVVTKGTAVATLKHDKAIPEHSLALSVFLNKKNFIQHNLSLEDAIRYLRKDPLMIESDTKGFQLVTYQDLPLGWINHIGSRINNLYPVSWRIKMEV